MVTKEELENMSPEEIRKLQEQNCIFCKIGKGEIPSKVVYQDDRVVAFLDIQPLSFGHVAITTKKHYVFFSQVPDEESSHLFKIAKRISQSMLKALQVQGTNISIGSGEISGQQIPHFLVHIIPRKEKEKIEYFHPLKDKYTEADLAKIQEALISKIDQEMNTNMKNKILTKKENEDIKEEKQASQKTQKDSEEHKKTQSPEKEETKEIKEKNTDQDQKETKQNNDNMFDKKEDDQIDLDKISKLFG